MDTIEENMADETYSVAKKVGLEAHKSLKLESNAQFGFVFRVTLKVTNDSLPIHFAPIFYCMVNLFCRDVYFIESNFHRTKS